MATRNPANVIEFGKVNFGATTHLHLAQLVLIQVTVKIRKSPAVQQKGTVIGLGSESGGAFNLYMENSSWTAADMETAVQALGGTLAGASVAAGDL